MKKFFLAAISVFFLFSCSNTTTLQNNGATGTGTTVKQKDIADTSWKLTAISGEKITPKMMLKKDSKRCLFYWRLNKISCFAHG